MIDEYGIEHIASLERRGSLTIGWMDWTGVERDGGAWLTEELSEHFDWRFYDSILSKYGSSRREAASSNATPRQL